MLNMYDRIITAFNKNINHEVNDFRINEICKTLIYRYPFWVRDGYVEELYAL
jgi:hypothetical protein